MRLKLSYIFLILATGLVLVNSSCKKDKLLTSGGSVRFSVDTLKFDTVFTAAGSFTTLLKIFNPQNQEIVLSSVRMENGNTSYFHINVDGFPGNNVPNLKIRAHDSIYVFATVNIDPTDTNNPFVITDNLIATLNGKDFSVPFTAYGQNAHYVVADSFGVDTTFLTDKPYVILQSAEVGPTATLTIPAKCRIYMNADSRIVVLGTLKINGTVNDTVVIQGDRLDRAYFGYQGYPGEWGGIYFDSYSKGSEMHYVRLENCGNSALGAQPAAMQVNADSVHDASNLQLKMDHVLIQNSIGYGILSFGGTIHAENCLVNTCGAEVLAITQGGNDTFVNCTFANYGSDKVSHVDHRVLAIANYLQDPNDNTHFILGNLNAQLTNCIVYGSLDSEVFCDQLSGATANINFDHCLLKVGVIPSFVTTSNCVINQDPAFTDHDNMDFHIGTSSPAANVGLLLLPDDFDGKARTTPDIGCYQSK